MSLNRPIEDIGHAQADRGKPSPPTPLAADGFTWGFAADTFDINVKGTIITVQKALPLMGSGGSILTGSSAGNSGIPGFTAYSASKAAVRSDRPTSFQQATMQFSPDEIRPLKTRLKNAPCALDGWPSWPRRQWRRVRLQWRQDSSPTQTVLQAKTGVWTYPGTGTCQHLLD